MSAPFSVGLAFVSLATLAYAGSRAAQPRLVRSAVTASYGAFHGLDSVEVVSQTFVPGRPLDSSIDMDVRGVLEGNLCGDDDVGLEPRLVDATPTVEDFHVYLRQLTLHADGVVLEKPACPSISKPEDFRARLRLKISEWRDGQTSKTWMYHFRNAEWTLATLEVTFDLETGWRARLHTTDN